MMPDFGNSSGPVAIVISRPTNGRAQGHDRAAPVERDRLRRLRRRNQDDECACLHDGAARINALFDRHISRAARCTEEARLLFIGEGSR